jgi:hypothetical protein
VAARDVLRYDPALMSEPIEPEKPRPKVRAMSVHDLRQTVTARHKMLSANKPLEEGVKLIEDEYKVNHDSALLFVQWLRGELPGAPPEDKNKAIDRFHVVTDPKTGDDRYIETEPGSIPPRPVGSKKPTKGR